MKNVTISMDDADLAWVRAQAGMAGLSVSRWIAERVTERHRRDQEMVASAQQIEAIYAMIENQRQADRLGGVVYEPRTQTMREMINEAYDERFRRFDDVGVSAGPDRSGESSDLRNVAEGGEAFRHAGSGGSGTE